VWGKAHAQNGASLRVFMAHLRQKIEEHPSQPRHLLTEIGVGYRFVL
jgi:two-component system KDP operon response regulator KdpE